MRQTRPAPLLSISNTSEYWTNYSQRIGKRIWCVVQKNDMNVSWHGTTKGLSSNQANKCYQNLILPLIPLQYFHTKTLEAQVLSHFLIFWWNMWRRPPGPLGQGGAVKISKLRWTLCYPEPALLTVVKVSSLDFWISPVIYSWNKKQNFNNSKANLNRGFGSSTKPVWCSGWPLQVSWLCYNADAPVKSDRWMESPYKSQICFS